MTGFERCVDTSHSLKLLMHGLRNAHQHRHAVRTRLANLDDDDNGQIEPRGV
jgi:hypothetical protein